MTQQEWLALTHKHRINIEQGLARPVRALLFGGSGIDQRLVGEGDDANEAIEQALHVRERMKSVLP